jgi:hypothetical protein
MKPPIAQVLKALKPVFRSSSRTIGTFRMANRYRGLSAFMFVSIGAEQIFKKRHAVASHGTSPAD